MKYPGRSHPPGDVKLPPRYMRKLAPPVGSESWIKPWAQLRTFNFHPSLFPAMVGAVSPEATPGGLVAVYDKEGKHFGTGMFNPTARVPLRVFHHGPEPVGEDHLDRSVEQALAMRLDIFKLPEQTDAFRVINSDGDALGGLIIDRYADVLSIEVHSLGIYQRLPRWLPMLHARLGTKRIRLTVDSYVAKVEGIRDLPEIPSDAVRKVHVREHGLRYEVDFAEGHKTGFFCDQRDNRLKFARMVQGRRVLDLCCYTGGFSVGAAVLGKSEDVTGVDLDEDAIAQARRNGNLNHQNRIQWVHADAFTYARQMYKNGQRWPVVMLDPPKLMESRETEWEGWRKYEDLNGLGIALVEPGGLLVTCSCSGLVSMEEFEHVVIRAAHKQHRRLQIFDRTGAGPDHPMMSNCPESQYLKVIWSLVR
ncbi:MAG: class I SAM-dependent rRNA methyltransferase [Verrucomicrobiota bacterium]